MSQARTDMRRYRLIEKVKPARLEYDEMHHIERL